MQRISGSQPIPSTAGSSVHLELLAHHPCRSNRPCLGRRCCRALHSCRPALADRLRRSCRENPRHQVRLSINATSSNSLSVLPPELAPHCAQMCAWEGANLEGRLCRGCHSCPQGLARPGRRGHRGHQVCPERLQSGKDRRCLLFATQIFPPVHAHTVYCIETFALTLRCVLHAFVRAC